MDATPLDDDSIVGEECHIISRQPNGPRHELLPESMYDVESNLILLCAVHHKMIDDQHSTYDIEFLRELKANHEQWVREVLGDKEEEKSSNVRKPIRLKRLSSAKELVQLVGGAHAFDFDDDDIESDVHHQILKDLLQMLQDLGDMWYDLEIVQRMEVQRGLHSLLVDAEAEGLLLYGKRVVREVYGVDMDVAILKVVHDDNTTTHLSGES